MSKNLIIAPSILSGDFGNMADSVKKIAEWGGDWVHCDVMDGVYVPNFTFGMPMVKAIKKASEKPLDVHLMMIKPEKYADRFIERARIFLPFIPKPREIRTRFCVPPTIKTNFAGIAFQSRRKYSGLRVSFPGM
jgi:ribulose-phosphate 3-epimerase